MTESTPDPPTAPRSGPFGRAGALVLRGEGVLVGAMLAAMAILPLAEAGLRLVGGSLAGVQPVVQHLTLWVAFLGAALGTARGEMLALATGEALPAGRPRAVARGLAHAVAALASALLARAGIDLVVSEHAYNSETLHILGLVTLPVWVAQAVLPVAFVLITLRLIARAGGAPARLIATAAAAAGVWIGHMPQLLEGRPVWPWLALLGLAMAAGTPIFAVLGGAAIFLFLVDGVPLAAVPVETYRLAVSPTLPAIPLFTLAGFLLAEGRSSERLLSLFRALLGWLPGGTAVMTAAVCAFFTIFTGGSGVTILALGALLHTALLRDGYRDRFATGLITASGSLGLLWAPALPLILYGIVAQVPINDLFLGGVLPGLVLLGMIAGWGIWEGSRRRRNSGQSDGAQSTATTQFSARALGRAAWAAKWEMLLPAIVLTAIFSGTATLVEASAVAALYSALVVVVVYREVGLRQLFGVLTRAGVMVGGILIILGVAMGLTSYLVDAQVPDRLLGWVEANVGSALVFLLALNVLLILVGCLMDIFSAIVVIVPLVAPLGAAFGIDPVHLGIIFVANLELGYLTPPVGLNLFLASMRFERPLVEVYRSVLVPLVLLAIGVIIITYVPFLSTALVR